jgi:hypothetical protein
MAPNAGKEGRRDCGQGCAVAMVWTLACRQGECYWTGMPSILSEERGTKELVRAARYHHAALLADPLTLHLAPAVKTRIEALLKAESQSDAADAVHQEKQALRDRAEYLHDDEQRSV